jgi:hypothetical protein
MQHPDVGIGPHKFAELARRVTDTSTDRQTAKLAEARSQGNKQQVLSALPTRKAVSSRLAGSPGRI